MNRTVQIILKFAVSLAILLYLIADIRESAPNTLSDVLTQPKDWWCIAAALACYAGALFIGLVRWCLLARALQVPFPFVETLRIGAFAYVVEIVGIGVAGGDATRATMLARINPGFAAPAIVSVAVDRVIGGFVILWYLSVSSCFVELRDPAVATAVHTIRILALASIVGLAIWAVLPGLTTLAATKAKGLGRAGRFVANMIEAGESYRGRAAVLITAFAITTTVLVLLTATFFLLALGLPGGAPTWREHTVIIPLLSLTSLVPLPVQGLGVFDYTLSYLYQHVAALPPPLGQGLLVAMAVRLASMLLCAVAGAMYALLPAPRSN